MVVRVAGHTRCGVVVRVAGHKAAWRCDMGPADGVARWSWRRGTGGVA